MDAARIRDDLCVATRIVDCTLLPPAAVQHGEHRAAVIVSIPSLRCEPLKLLRHARAIRNAAVLRG
jgi:hypothetical protein